MRTSPTIETLGVFAVVFALQQTLTLVDAGLSFALFVLSAPLDVRPWTVVTSVYAHTGWQHLLSNSIALALVGFALERRTTRWRFHTFFIVTGAIAGIFQVVFNRLLLQLGLVEHQALVLGASGAVFALFGYVIAGNRLTGGLLDRIGLDPRWQALLFGVAAVLVTLATAAPGIALVAHFVGVLLGFAAGRMNLLRPTDPEPDTPPMPEY
ncbi:Membrane associated serine protease, rhomboid family [Natronoarchaeum philippinense]|uniref:Membrane associated serine protease, rhomboid family n=1 Tax=Natronoarchaeum philippinense TaxID=558529 RepID=A0A285NAD3_NATPI|nr:rhomboid family intramembrane serine protease [Natronoarchaeum philippinense]SNZ06432.1 Membrane associated serine protease, rhomboid family [Natronoarchaeum philippinense]